MLEKIVMFLVYTAIVAGIVAGIIYLFYQLYKKFYSTKRAYMSDIKEFAAPDATLENFAARLAEIVPFLGFAPMQKTRKLFFKKVRQHIKKGVEVRSYDTPRDIAGKIKVSENIDALTGEYEAVRYYKNESQVNND